MLVVSRKEGESVSVGDDIVITIVKTLGNRVKVGISAPNHMKILREEIIPASEGEKNNDSDE